MGSAVPGTLAPDIHRSVNIANSELQSSILAALQRYWPNGAVPIKTLPIPRCSVPDREPLPPLLTRVKLPEWASDLAPSIGLPVPAYAVVDSAGPVWSCTDWWQVAFWYLNGTAERAFEAAHGPIHSYSYRLDGWDPSVWECAWVNRIALFLRRWSARQHQADETELLGALPEVEIAVTHDVDAVTKTPSIRFKQSAFQGFNGIRKLAQGSFCGAQVKFRQAARFLFSGSDYWLFDHIATMEERHGLRSCFNVYGGRGGWLRSPKHILFDPSYNVARSDLSRTLKELALRGWQIGVHQSFDAWRDSELMAAERQHVERALEQSVTTCRQHWLRFSWKQTWAAQQQAGFKLDSTLGFNDRPGFRCGAALRFRPLAPGAKAGLEAVPMVLMDSHLYDYLALESAERYREMQRWLDEVRFVRGQATVIWHTHVLATDYGWSDGFAELLRLLDRGNS